MAFAIDALTECVAPKTLLAEVQRAWPSTAPAPFSQHAEPVSERDGTITIACRSAVLAQELDLFSEAVIEALNGALGRPAVRRLRPQAAPPRA